MQTFRQDISLATYILIVLHFLRLGVCRATVSRMPNYPDDTALPPPEGCEYKVVIFYRTDTGTFRAMEFYTKTLQGNNELYHQIVNDYPTYTSNIYCLIAKDNLPDTFRSKSFFGEALRLLQSKVPVISMNEQSNIWYNITSIIGNRNTYRDIKIC